MGRLESLIPLFFINYNCKWKNGKKNEKPFLKCNKNGRMVKGLQYP